MTKIFTNIELFDLCGCGWKNHISDHKTKRQKIARCEGIEEQAKYWHYLVPECTACAPCCPRWLLY